VATGKPPHRLVEIAGLREMTNHRTPDEKQSEGPALIPVLMRNRRRGCSPEIVSASSGDFFHCEYKKSLLGRIGAHRRQHIHMPLPKE